MIRATTGHPAPALRSKDVPIIRPSSAQPKLESASHHNIFLDNRPQTSAVQTRSIIPQKVHISENNEIKPNLDRRLTLCMVDGIGNNAKVLTRLNTPASSKKKIKIEERITLEQLHKIKTAFEEADTDGSGTLDIDEFKTVVKTCLGVRGRNEEQIVALFMKIDSSSDGEIDWDEFCTYMQLEYAEKEEALLRSKRLRFLLPALTSITPHHKAPVLRVHCISDNSFMCAGQDGLLSFWTADLKLRKTRSIIDSQAVERQSYVTKHSMWVTDVAVLLDHSKLVIGTGEREIQFYELLTFEFYCQIIGLDAVPLRMDLCQIDEDKCLIVYGDDQGCVSIITFDTVGETLRTWKKVAKVNGVPTITMHDVANGKATSFVKWKVHEDWVTELRYFHELRSVISTSNHAATALVRGCTTASTALDNLNTIMPTNSSVTPSQSHTSTTTPQLQKNEKVRRCQTFAAQRRQKSDQSVFFVYKGVKTFDFSKENNILATGGMDRIVRLWNPYVPQKPTGLLKGHNSPIMFISIAGEDGRMFSISADKCIKVWDLIDQNCLVTINPKLHKIHGEIMTCCYTQQLRTIAVATDHLSLLRIHQNSTGPMSYKSKVKQPKIAEGVTHTEGVTCCTFNSHFGHIITCSEGSAVKLWDFESGTFMFEFNKAHGKSAITCAIFDSSGRRLITSGRDGAVRLWNYNNGHCLRSLERMDSSKEVADCVYVEINKNRYIIAVGWDQRVNIFSDETDNFHQIQRPYPYWPDDVKSGHSEDIVSVAFGRPNILATVSYDGLIIVWNIVSGHSIARIEFPEHCLPEEDLPDEKPSDNKTTDKLDGHRAVNRLCFLSDRLLDKTNACLLAGCSDGHVILWNINTKKAHARWSVTSKNSELSAMKTSEDGGELFIGDSMGYVSLWDIEDYAMSPLHANHDIVCPVKSPPPTRLANWRCHVQPITWLEIIESHDVVLTASTDFTVRVWSMDGHYVGGCRLFSYRQRGVCLKEFKNPCFTGTFGQSTRWDIHDPTTWQHPMVPPEVLLDPDSMPDHPIMHRTFKLYDSSDESDGEGEMKDGFDTGRRLSSHSFRGSSGSWLKGGGNSSESWKRRLSRRLSRSSMESSKLMHSEEEKTMLDDVRKSMCKSAGKRLRHEKLVAQQRLLRVTTDACSHAFQSLECYNLVEPTDEMDRPDPKKHLDDVFIIKEENEEIDV